jgi:hypothetical protein
MPKAEIPDTEKAALLMNGEFPEVAAMGHN